GLFALLEGINAVGWSADVLLPKVLSVWLSRALGIVAVAPPLLMAVTPWLVHYRLAYAEPLEYRFPLHPRLTWTTGDLLRRSALLVGASADWIRASEARYRQVVGHIPVVLYSARFLQKPTPGVPAEVEILLVSQAAKTVLGADPEALVGSYRRWLEVVHPED